MTTTQEIERRHCDSESLERVASNVEHIMQAERLTLGDVSRLTGLGMMTLHRIMRRERAILITTLEQLASGLGVRPADLLRPRRVSPRG